MSLARIGRLVLATGAVTAMVVAGIGTRAHADHDEEPGLGWAHWKAKDVLLVGGYAGVAPDKKYIGACDMNRNGDGIFAQYQLVGDQEILKVGDGNGSKAGCGTATAPRNIYMFRVCEDAILEQCSAWTLVQ